MKVYQSIGEFKPLAHAVSTIGTFDGVHEGHRTIISRLCELAREEKGESVVLTFFPHPRMVLQPDDNSLKLLTTMSERIDRLKKLGVDHLIIQTFNKEFSRQSAVEFVRDILVNKIGTKTLVIGYDHHFGRNREGSFKDLEEMAPTYGFRLEEIPKQVINELAVSSTKIRNSLLTGDVQRANDLLGYDFSLTGRVVDGDRIGRTLGFPTANISIAEQYKLIPATGIYAVLVKSGDEIHKGMLYIGYRPVVQGRRLSVEVNIFDFDRNIYNHDITVVFKARIRDDVHLRNLEELKKKMNEDKLVATKLLS